MNVRTLLGMTSSLVTGLALAAGPVAELYSDRMTLLNDFDDGTLKPTVGDVASGALSSQYLIGDGGVLGTKALLGGGYYFDNTLEKLLFDASKPGSVVFLVKLVTAFDPIPAKEPGATPFSAMWSSTQRLLIFRQSDLSWGSSSLGAYYHYTYPEGGQYVVRADDYAGSLKGWTAGDWHLVVMTHTPDAIGISVDGRAIKETMMTERMPKCPWRVYFNTEWGSGSSAGRFAMDDCAILDFKLSDDQVRELYEEYQAIAGQEPRTEGAPYVTAFATEPSGGTGYLISTTVTNPAASSVEVKFSATATPENSQPASSVQTVTLAAGEARTFTLSGPVLGEEKVTADVSVTTADGATVWFRRKRVFAPNAPEPEDPSAMSFKFAYYPSTNTVHATVDVSYCDDWASATNVRLDILDATNKTVLATRSFAPGASGKTEVFWRDVPELAGGEYICRATVEGVANACLDQAFVRRRFAWEGNRYGLSDTVPAPFTAVERSDVEGEAGLEKVSVVLRDHIVDRETGLWQQVTAAGKEILARPMALVDAVAHRVNEDEENPSLTRRASASTTWDVDGMMVWKLTLSPGHYEPMALEIPLRAERATLWHACTDGIRINDAGALTNGVGRIWDSTVASHRNIVGNYVPYLWVGGPLRGIAVFGENEKGWVLEREQKVGGESRSTEEGIVPSSTSTSSLLSCSCPCQEIVREEDGTVVIRLNLIQTDVDVTEARTIKIGFMATPVKPMLENWRSVGHGTLLGACYYWGAYTASESVEPFDGTDEFLRKMAEARQTGVVDEAYLKRACESYPYTQTPGTAAWTNKYNTILAHYRSGLYNSKWAGTAGNLVFYTNGRGVHYGDASEQGATYCNEWNLDEYMNRAFTLASSAAYDLDPVASYRDYAAWWYERMLATGAANHLYWDDVFCSSSFNLVQTDAYRLPSGRIQPSSGIFNMRALVKRCAVLQAEKGLDTRGNWVHMTNTALAPVLSFAGVNYDWEDIADTRTFQERYSRGYILAATIGRQYGNRVGIMGYFDKTDPEVYAHLAHTGVGVMLTHELRWNASGHDEYVAAHKLLTDWGYRTDAVRVWNYWDEDETYPLEVTGVENASIAMAKTAAGEAMVCVSSFAATNGTVRIRPDVEALGFAAGSWRASDAQTGAAVSVVNGAIELSLDAYDWALVKLTGARPDGTYAPVEFIQTDGYSYLDTGIAGNPKKVQQKARLQFLAKPTSSDYIGVFGSCGSQNLVSYQSCALCVSSSKTVPGYSGSDSEGYYWGAPTKNAWWDFYLHHGYAETYGGVIARSGLTGVGYNWNSLQNTDLPTLLVGNVNNPYSVPFTTPGQVVPMRWYSYEAIDHDTGASLVRLTPVRCVESGEYGMLDEVNGGFYASALADHPFLGPVYVAWTGRETTYPSNAIIRVAAGTTNVVSHADVATISDMGGILVEDRTSVFSFSNCTAAATLYAPLYGSGTVRQEYGSATLNLSEDSRAFGGTLSVYRANANVYNKYGLGLTNRLEYGTGGTGSRLLDFHTGLTFKGPVRLRGTGDGSRLVVSASDQVLFTGPVELALETKMVLHGANGSVWFTGTVTNLYDSWQNIDTSSIVGFEGDVERNFGTCYLRSGSNMSIGGRIHVASRGYGIWQNPQSYGQVGATGGNSVHFLNANVLDEDVNFLMGWSYTDYPTPSGKINLNGYDQRVGRLMVGVGTSKGGSITTETRPQATGLQITSASPATLTVRNTGVYGHSPYCTRVPGCWPGRVNGAASVAIDTMTSVASPGLVAFSCEGSDTTGGLYARRGTILVYETASFPNLTELVASGAGQFDIRTSEIGGGNLGLVLTNATLSTGQVPLTIASGCTLKVNTALVTDKGRRVWLRSGEYGATDLPTLIGGAGTLKVSRYGGKGGSLLLIR